MFGWCTEACVHVRQVAFTVSDSSLSVGFSRQDHWSGLLFPSPGDLLGPRIEPAYLMSPALTSGIFTTSATWEGSIKDCVSHRPL